MNKLETAEAAFKRIRESTELGPGSCSGIDECYEDSELMEEIYEVLEGKPDATPEEIFQDILDTDRACMEVLDERMNTEW